VEDQQASTVKGEEDLSPELNDEAAEVQDTELEASPEVVQADAESAEESQPSEEVVDSALDPTEDEEPDAEAEEPDAEVEEADAEVEEPEAETEEPVAGVEEPEAEVEEPETEVEEPEAEVEEPEAEVVEPEAEVVEPEAEVEEAVSEESQEEAAAEMTDEEVDPVDELEIAAMEGEALTETPFIEAPVNGNDGQVSALAEELAAEAEAETSARRVAEPDDGREWYVVHCYSGYENKVRHNLEQRIETMDMKGKIFDVVVPTEEEMEVKEGKRRTIERRVFPGYILVQMIMDEDSWYVVRNTPGVTGFVGMGNEPTPLRPEEVSQIVKRMEADAPRIKVTYDVGQKVRIIDGPFNDFIGTVDDIDMAKAKVRVMVSFFGRETPVELDFLQVEKA
jgi:transcriptional antiterminator NusG